LINNDPASPAKLSPNHASEMDISRFSREEEKLELDDVKLQVVADSNTNFPGLPKIQR